jgi:ankyrin repeat protein
VVEAAGNGDLQGARRLIEDGADVNAGGDHDRKAVTGADRSIADRDGVTPLQHARRRGYEAMVEALEG